MSTTSVSFIVALIGIGLYTHKGAALTLQRASQLHPYEDSALELFSPASPDDEKLTELKKVLGYVDEDERLRDDVTLWMDTLAVTLIARCQSEESRGSQSLAAWCRYIQDSMCRPDANDAAADAKVKVADDDVSVRKRWNDTNACVESCSRKHASSVAHMHMCSQMCRRRRK